MKKDINMSCAHKYRGQKEMSVFNECISLMWRKSTSFSLLPDSRCLSHSKSNELPQGYTQEMKRIRPPSDGKQSKYQMLCYIPVDV